MTGNGTGRSAKSFPATMQARCARAVRVRWTSKSDLVRLARTQREAEAEALLGGLPQLDAPDRAERDDERIGHVVVLRPHVQRDHPVAGLGLDPLERERGTVGEHDLDRRRLHSVLFGERGNRTLDPLDERLVRPLRDRRPDAAQKSFTSGSGSAPMCARPSFVIVRPRGVRWMKPSCSRYGS